ncbi:MULTISPECIES: IclR family transcriptional regulator [Sporosarcina]|uniref:Transcriptional regulator, IclR family n=2 Tax=Sporosarcina newyorkensis TaxID=759851 RepID=A0A1T4YV88_9BACL|nr:IclR family transcriptional regulator [Sporosarcina newyorkensis]EGQ25714.1 IclR family transcriptional regulator [Sporosarcina newyorkensis 2681]MBY0224080.1 IclR family transcriptional regulator [Sporosarcina aquimarina]SKB05498.1 transcriptional regulator, IclR family [Sporosarcina newyorkensis]
MIESVKKACYIISCFSSEEPVLGNAEIAGKLGMSPSTTHHLISTLCNEGVLMRDKDRRYRLGWKLLEWNNNVMFQQDIYDKAIPLVKDLISRFIGTAHIGMFDKGEVVFVLKISSQEASPIHTYIGSRKPAYATSTGKVLLAYNNDYLKETIERGLSQQAPNTITNIEKLKEDLKKVRDVGYSISNNENSTGTYAIAAPILSYSGKTIAAVNLAGPVSYMQGSNQHMIRQSVIKTADSISKELGYIEV